MDILLFYVYFWIYYPFHDKTWKFNSVSLNIIWCYFFKSLISRRHRPFSIENDIENFLTYLISPVYESLCFEENHRILKKTHPKFLIHQSHQTFWLTSLGLRNIVKSLGSFDDVGDVIEAIVLWNNNIPSFLRNPWIWSAS